LIVKRVKSLDPGGQAELITVIYCKSSTL